MSLKSEIQKVSREELKIIESHLHPLPAAIDGYIIMHRHQGQYVYFSAWSGDEQTDRELRVHRSEILYDKHFYNHNARDFMNLIPKVYLALAEGE